MKSIDADIKDEKIKNIYLLMGVEPYLIYQYRDKLMDALVSRDDEINRKKYTGEIKDINAVIEYADTVPFFAQRKVLVLEDTGLFKSSDDTLASYLKDLPETTYIIFVECYRGDKSEERKYERTLVDKRYKLFKAVQELGRVIEFKRTSEDILIKWLLKKFSDEGLSITRNAMDCLLENIGNDMMMLSNEAEKLICYRMGHKSIDVDDVKAVCSRNISNEVFEMVNAIAVKNKRKALKLYYDLIEVKESPMRILSLIGREFNLLLRVKAIRGRGGGQREVTEQAGIHRSFAGRYISVSGRLSEEYLKEAINDCVETEASFKQGRLNDTMGVEMLIIKYAG
ncbi:MAG: DNA polymerase III subunit delta [Lachnospiraceae bacterium]|nr:DNA polymerase III subunit delta [Lachnospiraceae bacterium]